MDAGLAGSLRALLRAQRVAALGTADENGPFVSMVPFAIPEGSSHFVIHVSRLAAHTKHMLASPRVGLMVAAPLAPGGEAQSLARVSIQGDASALAPQSPGYGEARRAYLERFPESEPMFGFADFALFAIVPRAVRFVGGFAQARSLTPEGFAAVLRDAAAR